METVSRWKLDDAVNERNEARAQNRLLKSAIDMALIYLEVGKEREAWSALRAAQQRYTHRYPRPVTKECCELWEAAE